MFTTISGAILIMLMRICDVTIGTFRTILVVQSRKYYAALNDLMEKVEVIDKGAFITIQTSRPFREYIHGSRV